MKALNKLQEKMVPFIQPWTLLEFCFPLFLTLQCCWLYVEASQSSKLSHLVLVSLHIYRQFKLQTLNTYHITIRFFVCVYHPGSNCDVDRTAIQSGPQCLPTVMSGVQFIHLILPVNPPEILNGLVVRSRHCYSLT